MNKLKNKITFVRISNLTVCIITIFIIFFISSCFASSSLRKEKILAQLKFQKTPQIEHHLRILTVYHTSSGVITQKKDKILQAQLNSSKEDITYFTDLPSRQQGRMNAKKFFNLCQQGTCCSLQNNGELIYQTDYQKSRIELPVSIKSVRWISDTKGGDYLVVDFNLLSKTETFRAGEMKDVVFLIYQHCY